MLTILVAALAGWAVGRRSSPFTWAVGAVLVTIGCVIVAVMGWSIASTIEAMVAVLAFNAVALIVGATRRSTPPPATRKVPKAIDAPVALTPRSNTLA